jgi:hypothetical protein
MQVRQRYNAGGVQAVDDRWFAGTRVRAPNPIPGPAFSVYAASALPLKASSTETSMMYMQRLALPLSVHLHPQPTHLCSAGMPDMVLLVVVLVALVEAGAQASTPCVARESIVACGKPPIVYQHQTSTKLLEQQCRQVGSAQVMLLNGLCMVLPGSKYLKVKFLGWLLSACILFTILATAATALLSLTKTPTKISGGRAAAPFPTSHSLCSSLLLLRSW